MRFFVAVQLQKTHIAGSVITAADFLFRLELEVREKIRLEIREDVKTTTIEVAHPAQTSQTENNSSSRKKMVKMTLKHKHLKGESNLAKKAAEWVANEEPSTMKPSFKEFTNLAETLRVIRKRNQGKCTNRTRASFWSSSEEFDAQNTGPATWWMLWTTMLKSLRLHSGAAIDSAETTKLPPLPEVVC